MGKFYNPGRSPINVVLADGSSAFVGGHKTLVVEAISASIRRAERKGLLIRLSDPVDKLVPISKVVGELLVKEEQAAPKPQSIEISLGNEKNQEGVEDTSNSSDLAADLLESAGVVESEGDSDAEDEENPSDASNEDQSPTRRRRRKKRSR